MLFTLACAAKVSHRRPITPLSKCRGWIELNKSPDHVRSTGTNKAVEAGNCIL